MVHLVKAIVMFLYIIVTAIPIAFGFLFELLRIGFKAGIRSVEDVENWCEKND